MPKQNIQLANNEIYHICLRAVGDAIIFKDDNDRFRMIFSLYEFNNSKFVSIFRRRRDRIVEKKKEKLNGLGERPVLDYRDSFVEILAFCFMPNHVHLLLCQLQDNGISRFMQKVGGGYASYFNNKYKRKGHLFNQFKPIHIKNDKQLKNVVTYIHCNPISLLEPGWKEKGIKKPTKVIKFLEGNYRWSSFFDYLGKRNFPSITSRDSVLIIMGGSNEVKESVKSWIRYNKIEKFDYLDFEK